jgi:hypothetical protein
MGAMVPRCIEVFRLSKRFYQGSLGGGWWWVVGGGLLREFLSVLREFLERVRGGGWWWW